MSLDGSASAGGAGATAFFVGCSLREKNVRNLDLRAINRNVLTDPN